MLELPSQNAALVNQ